MSSSQYRMLVRQDLVAQCKLRVSGTLARTAIVRNLTRDGCAVECIPASVKRGDTVYLQLGNVGPVEGKVVWLTKGMAAGIRFEDPLYPAVFDKLVHVAHRNMILGQQPRSLEEQTVSGQRSAPRMAAC